MQKITKLALAFMFASAAVFADNTSEVKEYLESSTQLVQKHLDALTAAESANQAAAVLKKYAAEMKPMMKKSNAIKKKYPDMGTDESLKAQMEAMGNVMMQMNQKIGEARQKYGKDRLFKQAEKALQQAGLYGKG